MIAHSLRDLEAFPAVMDQKNLRTGAVRDALAGSGVAPSKLSAVVDRGGLLPPVKSGAYRVNETMLKRLRESPMADHPANLGAVIAKKIANEAGVSAYVYDSIAVDELSPVAKLSGLPCLERKCLSLALNSRAMALRWAAEHGRS